jgi:hypothetical protein
LIGALVGGGVWGWLAYQNRPYVVDTLAGIRLGMTPLEVQLVKGKGVMLPPLEQESVGPNDRFSSFSLYGDFSDHLDPYVLGVSFRGNDPHSMRVTQVCEKKGNNKLLGIGHYSKEQDVIDRLDEPSRVSINAEGLRKYLSYEQWKVGFEIEQGNVIEICITESGELIYHTEYGDEPDKGKM